MVGRRVGMGVSATATSSSTAETILTMLRSCGCQVLGACDVTVIQMIYSLVNIRLFSDTFYGELMSMCQVLWQECNSCWPLWGHFRKPAGIKYFLNMDVFYFSILIYYIYLTFVNSFLRPWYFVPKGNTIKFAGGQTDTSSFEVVWPRGLNWFCFCFCGKALLVLFEKLDKISKKRQGYDLMWTNLNRILNKIFKDPDFFAWVDYYVEDERWYLLFTFLCVIILKPGVFPIDLAVLV